MNSRSNFLGISSNFPLFRSKIGIIFLGENDHFSGKQSKFFHAFAMVDNSIDDCYDVQVADYMAHLVTVSSDLSVAMLVLWAFDKLFYHIII